MRMRSPFSPRTIPFFPFICWAPIILLYSLEGIEASTAVFQGSCSTISPCEHFCKDLNGKTLECSCREGYFLLGDGISCRPLISGVHAHRTTLHPRYQTQRSAPRPEQDKATVPLKNFKSLDDSSTSKVSEDSTIENAYQPIHFGSQSYMAFPVPRSMYLETNISIQFRPDHARGNQLLFYAGQEFGRDFLSISLSENDVILRFDCGEGTAEEKYEAMFGDDHWHSVFISRHFCDESKIQVDKKDKILYDNTDFKHYKGITVSKQIYLGGVPKLIREESVRKAGTSSYFEGCVKRLVVNGETYLDDKQHVDLSIERHNTGKCGATPKPEKRITRKCTEHSCATAMSSNPVLNPSVKGVSGKAVGIKHPKFSGDSYLEFPARRDLSDYLEVEIKFNATEPNGVLFYSGSADGSNPFVVSLESGYLNFRFDLGEGTTNLRSSSKITLGTWERVEFWRSGRGGLLKLQNQPWVEAMGPGSLRAQRKLHLSKLFIGGMPSGILPSKLKRISNEGFHGCIRKIVVNQKRLRPRNSVSSKGMSECGSDPCQPNPCGEGDCTVLHDHYLCLCPFPKTGPHCEHTSAPTGAIGLSGNGFLQFKQRQIMDLITGDLLDLSMRLKIDDISHNGKQMIAFAGKESIGGDFFEVYVNRKGHLTVKMNLGSGTVRITHEGSHLKDGQWHTLRVKRIGRKTTLIVDNHTPVTTVAPEGSIQMNVYDSFLIGGLPPSSGMFAESGLRGCIANATLGKSFDITRPEKASRAINLRSCGEL